MTYLQALEQEVSEVYARMIEREERLRREDRALEEIRKEWIALASELNLARERDIKISS